MSSFLLLTLLPYVALGQSASGDARSGGREQPPRSGLYELTTGAESLESAVALSRIGRAGHQPAKRRVPLDMIEGVKIADHPWDKMRKGKKPRPEPLAEAVPHDNWYLTVGRADSLAELAVFVEGWGSPLRWALPTGRDPQLLKRYQTQLCLPIKELAKAVPAKLVRGIALTGSDLFWMEGTDVTVIVDTSDPRALLKAIDGPLARARKLHGLTRRIRAHGGVGIEGYASPGREVSLYRVVVRERVVISNSRPALHRVLDTVAGKRRSLAKSPDFQYMRTAFVRDEKEEDGFAFLSDDFFRSLVGPALRIKAMRRLSSRIALMRASDAALTFAFEEHRWPTTREEVARFGVRDGEPFADAEGACILWDSVRGEASSRTYGTLSHGTPLIEIDIDKATFEERKVYREFRGAYESGWRSYIDPVGIRMKQTTAGIRAEAFMLPLKNSQGYELLRQFTRGKETSWSSLPVSPAAVFQFRVAVDRVDFGWLLDRQLGLGVAVQLDDAPDLLARAKAFAEGRYRERKWPPVPLVLSFGGKDATNLRKYVDQLLALAELSEWVTSREAKPHKGVEVKEYLLGNKPLRDWDGLWAVVRELADSKQPTLYCATFGGGSFFSFNRQAIESRIDAWKKGAKMKGDPASAGFFLTRNRRHVSALIEWLLERQVRKQAHSANALWQSLYDARVVTPKMSEAEQEQVALRLWGFVPAAPDGSRSVWDAETRQVRNLRHGTSDRPTSHKSLDPKSPLLKFLRRFESVNADLRFREDGIHTIITFGYVK
jgi:hypothetical protein